MEISFKQWLESTALLSPPEPTGLIMATSNFYWITPRGEIIDGNGYKNHIDYVIAHPEQFRFTKEQIEELYVKHNEPMGLEGQARNEIMSMLYRMGFVRVRNGYGRNSGNWTIETAVLNPKTIRNINNFVWKLKEDPKHQYDTLNVLQTVSSVQNSYSLNKWFEENG